MSCVKTSKNVLPVYFFRKKVLIHIDYETCVIVLERDRVGSVRLTQKLRHLSYNLLKNISRINAGQRFTPSLTLQ